MMFLSKLGETNRKIAYYESHYNLFDQIVQLDHIGSLKGKNDNFTTTINTSDYILSNNQKIKSDLLASDVNYNQYYRLDSVSEKQWKECFDGSPSAIVSRELARNLKLDIGDRFQLNDTSYTVKAISQDPFLEKKLLVPIDLYNNQENHSLDRILITIKVNENLDRIASSNSILARDSMGQIIAREVKSLNQFLLFLFGFFLVFFLISIINISLVLTSLISLDQKNRIVRQVCGESDRQYIANTIVEFTLIVLLSYHVAVILYYVLLPLVPEFFYFSLSLEVYLIELAFATILAFVLAVIYARKQCRTNIAIGLRGWRYVRFIPYPIKYKKTFAVLFPFYLRIDSLLYPHLDRIRWKQGL